MAEEIVIPTEICLVIGLLLLVIFFIVIYLLHRKKFVAKIEIGYIDQVLYEMDGLFRSRGWKTALNPSLMKIKVTKDSLVAADIYLRETGDGEIEVVSGSTTSELGWLVFLILLFGTSGLGGLVFILIIHYLSRKFAQKEISQLIMDNT